MLYLSKLTLASPILDAYQLHQQLWKAFENQTDSAQREFLFRIEEQAPRQQILLVHSCQEPHWEPWLAPSEYAVKAYDPCFREGQQFFFYLRANAVVAEKREGAKRSVKIPIRPKEYIQTSQDESGNLLYSGWLAKQASEKGFKLLAASRMGEHRAFGKKHGESLIRLTGQNLRGHLEITDATAFLSAYVNGLGRGKAFGFGMFSLIRS
ncbi:type I-E CRISPR-associated protein Cas6/Cse3/CasE [Deltaproteobacteria bacterium TL4]